MIPDKYIVGLTGGIASGKTTVSDLFKQKNIDIIDADLIAREVVEPGTPAYNSIVDKFGKDILQNDAQLDRATLRKKVFNSPADKDWLNALLHPSIRNEMLNQCAKSTSQYCILSVPLLIENSLNTLVDRVLVVDIPETMQLERALSRDGSDENTIAAIIKAQINRQMRLDAADDVIDNSQNVSQLNSQVEELHNKYNHLSHAKLG